MSSNNSSTWRGSSGPPRIGRIGDWSSNPTPPSAPHPPSDDDDDDDEAEEGRGPQSWFTGGERSGLSVQNPDSRRPPVPGGSTVRDLLRRAAEAGPVPEARAPRIGGTFIGGGHTLGSDDVESRFVPDPNAPASTEDEETVVRHITFWQDGFSVEDGELMRYDDPANERILAEINSGRASPHILNVLPGQPVELRVAKRLAEAYQAPPTRPFGGSGHRLGAPVPEVEVMPGTFAEGGSGSGSAGGSEGPELRRAMFEVDQTLPSTSVQIRLADGTRIVCRMNLTHTVLDLRNFINASRPENLTRPYTIGTTFPNRTLEDNSKTIEEERLQNSVVVQRWA